MRPLAYNIRMPRRRSSFTQADVTRAIRAALKAGVPVRGVEISADRIRVLTTSAEAAVKTLDEQLDDELADFQNKHARKP